MTSEVDFTNVRRRTHLKVREDDSDNYDFTGDAFLIKPKKTRRRKAKSRDSDDDESDNNGKEVLPKWKVMLVVVAICVCFALIFPTVFMPLLNAFWGRGGGGEGTGARRLPTPMGGRSSPPSRGGPAVHPQMHHMPTPHGGAGADTGAGRGGRGGMFTWMMPFYTIGVVAFLGYTLYKIMFKQRNKRRDRKHYDSEESDSEAADGEIDSRRARMVQRRLRKTEEAMREILEQLEAIAAAAGHNNNDNNHTQLENSAEIEKDNEKTDDGIREEKDDNKERKKVQPNGNDENANIRLSKQQVAEVERGLRELRELSDLYKQQQLNIQEDEDYDEEENSDYSEEFIESNNAQHEELNDISKLRSTLSSPPTEFTPVSCQKPFPDNGKFLGDDDNYARIEEVDKISNSKDDRDKFIEEQEANLAKADDLNYGTSENSVGVNSLERLADNIAVEAEEERPNNDDFDESTKTRTRKKSPKQKIYERQQPNQPRGQVHWKKSKARRRARRE